MSCSVEVQLDQDLRSHTFTSLEGISGKVIVKVNREIAVENIQIKLEGISRTKITKRVHSYSTNRSRLTTKNEEHNLLYDCDTLFPPDNIKSVTRNRDGFTLIPGKYDYNFSFKIPMNCYCGDPGSAKFFSNLYNSPAEKYAVTSSKAQRIQQQQQQNSGFSQSTNYQSNLQHIVCPLPPSTSGSGYNNSFDISYFLKVTVRRASMFKTNIRQVIPLSFTIFEPDSLTISRYLQTVTELNNRSNKFNLDKEAPIMDSSSSSSSNAGQEKSSGSGFLGKFTISASRRTISKKVPFQVDIKFTDKIIRPNEPPFIQMSLVTSLPPSEFIIPGTKRPNGLGDIFLSNLVITLIRTVTYRAENFVDTLTRTTDLQNIDQIVKLDLSEAIRNNEGLYELEFPQSLFQKMALPSDNFPPSFQSCNITSTYSLRIKANFKSKADSSRSQKVDFSTSVWVLSGAHIPYIPQGETSTSGQQLDTHDDPVPNFHQLDINNEPSSANNTVNPASQIIGDTPTANSLPIAQDNNNNEVQEELPTYHEAVASSLASIR